GGFSFGFGGPGQDAQTAAAAATQAKPEPEPSLPPPPPEEEEEEDPVAAHRRHRAGEVSSGAGLEELCRSHLAGWTDERAQLGEGRWTDKRTALTVDFKRKVKQARR
ncbi:hypothetical protein TeGR_g218, partial [Tetraparma gracilis]